MTKIEKKEFGKKRLFSAIVFTIVTILMCASGVYFYIQLSRYTSTDDAFITGNPIYVSSNVSGHITHIYVSNNQYVEKGTLLLTIDSSGYQLDSQSIQSQLVAAQAQLLALKSKYSGQQLTLQNSQKNVSRLETLALQNAVSTQDLENAITQLQVSQKGLQSLQSDMSAQEANIEMLQSKLSSAQLNLSYTSIYAPNSGYVTMNNQQVGNFVQAGTPILSIVTGQMWVSANFKETQLADIHVGDKVNFTIDAIPGKTFQGTVQSLQAGTGSVFSLLPPENATGNFVKVVQRIPVIITFDNPNDIVNYHIGLGISVVAKVIKNSNHQNSQGILEAAAQVSPISGASFSGSATRK